MPITRASLLSAEPATRVTAASLLAAGGTVSAGYDQGVAALDVVTLTAAGVASVVWSQVSGPAVTITPIGDLTATFVAPAGHVGSTVVARATAGVDADDVSIMVAAHGEWWWDGAVLRPVLLSA